MISTDFSEMYRMTLFIVGTANLVMAITLLLMYVVGKYRNTHFQQGVCFLAAAMMLMTCINYMELFMPINEAFLPHSQSYVVLAASIELFLLLYSVVLVLDPDFAFRRKIGYELLLILLFVVPSLVIEAEGLVRSLLFGLPIGRIAVRGITIEEVAVDLNTNRTTFSLFLNSELGQSFYEWISFLRVEEAKRLLIQNPTTPVLDIAIQVGIDDRSNFDKAFKRVVGLSPVAYRKSCLASSEASSK